MTARLCCASTTDVGYDFRCTRMLRAAGVTPAGLRPQVVTLCGSTRFRSEFDRVMRELTLAGDIVIGPGVWWAADAYAYRTPDQYQAVKEALDELHLRKIDLADVVLVVNVDGYIGESTAREIAYAQTHGKRVVYAYPQTTPPAPL